MLVGFCGQVQVRGGCLGFFFLEGEEPVFDRFGGAATALVVNAQGIQGFVMRGEGVGRGQGIVGWG